MDQQLLNENQLPRQHLAELEACGRSLESELG
jgi:hypothetical protein